MDDSTLVSMKQLAAILFATGFTYVVSLAAGKLLLQFLRVKLSRMEEHFLGFVLGAAALSTVVFALTATGQAHRGNFLAAGLVIVAFAVKRGAHRFSPASETPLPKPWKIVFAVCYGLFALLYLAHALLPEFSADGTGYHVAYVARYLREHRFPHITSFVAGYPQGVEMLFLFAFAFGKHSAAAMVHLQFLLVAPFGILAYGRRIGSPQAGAAAGLLFFLSPIVGKDGTSAYVDIALACAIFAVFLLLEIWRQNQQTGALAAVGLCAGFAFAVKYPGGLAIVYALAAVIFHQVKIRKPILRPAILVTTCALLLAAPWMIKNVILVGNPISPFANQVFPNRMLSAWAVKTIAHTVELHRGVTLTQLPLEATIGGSRVAGILGPIFLLTPLLLLGLGNRNGRRIACAAAVFAIPYYLDSDTRFAIPCLTFLSLGIAAALTRRRAVALSAVILHALASWPPALNHYVHPYAWRIDQLDWKAALRLTPESDFLRGQLPDYDIGLTIDKTVPAGEPVFSFSGIQQAYHTHEIINEWTSSFGTRISDTLRTPITTALQPTRRDTFRFPPITTQKLRVVQTEVSATDRWSITELRVFRDRTELERDRKWRLTASSYPWDVRLAFDNSAVTRWASDEPYRPGMYIEIDFGRVETIDQVTALGTRDQEQMHMRLEYESSPGHWQIAANAAVDDIPPPDRLRGAAIQELKRNHLHWLLVHDAEQERGADDFAHFPQLWGISLAATTGQYKLYHLE
jgi:hypothetical protein